MQNRNRSERIAVYGMLTALSMVLSYIESLLPLSSGIPGAKLGLANLVTVTALYAAGAVPAFWLSMLRIVLTGFSFGNLFSMWYSFSGFILSFFCMLLLKKSGRFGLSGVSAAGGIAHNLGQLFCAVLLLKSTALFSYLPFLLAAGVISGTVIGLSGAMLTRRLRPFFSGSGM